MEEATPNRVVMRIEANGTARGHISDELDMDMMIVEFHTPDQLISYVTQLKEKGIPPNSMLVNPLKLFGSWDGQIGYIVKCTCKENKG